MWRRVLDWCTQGDDRPAQRFSTADCLLAAILAIIAAGVSLHASGRVNPELYTIVPGVYRGWFEADQAVILDVMTGQTHTNRTRRHPLFVGVTSLSLSALAAAGADPLSAVRRLLAICAALTAAALFLAVRGLGPPPAAAVLFTGVFLASATFTHWFALIETYPLAAVSMSCMLLVLTSADTRRWPIWMLASAATLSITVTNWTLALAAMLLRMKPRNAALISASAFAIVAVLALAQAGLYPRTSMFLSPGAFRANYYAMRGEAYQLLYGARDAQAPSTMSAVAARLRAIVLTSAVAPPPEIMTGQSRRRARWNVTNQFTPLSTHNRAGKLALLAWTILLATGILGGLANVERRRIFGTICLFLLGQLVLHSVLGEITFLYAANWFGAFVLLVAFSWFSRFRVAALIASVVFIVCAGWSNAVQFDAAMRLFNSL